MGSSHPNSKMMMQIALFQLLFLPVFCNELEDFRKEFQAFKEITTKKIGELEVELSITKLENSELIEKNNLKDNFKEDIIASMNKTDGILDYLYTRIVELMVCVNDLDEMKNKFCLPPRITPGGLEIL